MAKIHSLKYGDAVVTNERVLKLFENCITEYTAIYIDNETFESDPKPGLKKSAEIDYTFNGLRRRRTQDQGAILNFEWEITRIVYGAGNDIWDNTVYLKKPDTVTKLYYWLDRDDRFTITNGNLGGDPIEGVKKTARITYRYANHTGKEPESWTLKGGENEQVAFNEHFGYIDRTSMTVRDPWEWQKRVLGVIPDIVVGKVSNN